MVSNELLMRFQNSLNFAGSIRHEYDDRFGRPGAKVGDSYKIRADINYTVGDGATITEQSTEERFVDLKLNYRKNVAFSFTSEELTLDIDNFSERYLKSAARRLANQFDSDLLSIAYKGVSSFVGVPGTTPTSIKTYQQASAWLDKLGTPIDNDRYVCFTPDMQVEVINDTRGLFESSSKLKYQYEKGRIKDALGMHWLMDQNVRTHTTGPFGGTPAVLGAGQSGTSLITNGWTAVAANRLKAGDILSIPACYAVNTITGDSLQDLAKFTVAADFDSDGAGAGTISLVSPGMVVSGPYKNCSNSPATGGLIKIFEKVAADQSAIASKASPQGLVYHKNFMAVAMSPLLIPNNTHFAARSIDKDTGMSIRIVSDFMIKTDEFITRADIFYGGVVAVPEFACRVVA